MLHLYLGQAVADPAGDRLPYPLAHVDGVPGATAEPECGGQLAREKVDLLLKPFGLPEVVELLGLLEVLLEIAETRPIFAARLLIERRSGVAADGAAGGWRLVVPCWAWTGKIRNMELSPG